MRRRVLCISVAGALLLACGAGEGGPPGEEHVRALHERTFVADLHNHMMKRITHEGIDIGVRNPETHLDIPKIKEGRIDFLLCAAFSPTDSAPYDQSKNVFDTIDDFHAAIAGHEEDIALVRSAAEIRSAASLGKTALMLSVEGGHSIENDLAMLRSFYRLGVRSMTLAWLNHTEWIESSNQNAGAMGAPYYRNIKPPAGLSDFGRAVVREMNRLGMVIDISHASDRAAFEILRETTDPVIASHSCARAVADRPRNLSDSLLSAIAGNGGVVGVNFLPYYLDVDYPDRFRKELSLLSRPGTEPPGSAIAEAARRAAPPIAKMVEHINHIVAVAGIDHVGLGSDFDAIDGTPAGLESGARLMNLTRALVEAGYPDEDVMKIMGGNVLRVIEEVTGG